MPPLLHPPPRLLLPQIQVRHASKFVQKANTIPVKLLRDVPKFGRKGSIIAVARGRMRNQLYPRALADYVPLNTPVSAVADTSFLPEVAVKPQKIVAARIDTQSPTKIVQELEAVLPATLQFRRALVEEDEEGGDGSIHGSVGPRDVVQAVRMLTGGRLQVVKEEWLEDMEKIKKVGGYEVTFRVKGSTEVCRRRVLVVPV